MEISQGNSLYKKCIHMYVNAKVRPDETIPVEGVNSNMMYLIYCKNLCKCHNVPHLRARIKGRGANALRVCHIWSRPRLSASSPLRALVLS
jgi:hypothetical protein